MAFMEKNVRDQVPDFEVRKTAVLWAMTLKSKLSRWHHCSARKHGRFLRVITMGMIRKLSLVDKVWEVLPTSTKHPVRTIPVQVPVRCRPNSSFKRVRLSSEQTHHVATGSHSAPVGSGFMNLA